LHDFGIASNQLRYIHFNRMIKKYDLDAFVISGPGHGAPGLISNFYLEGVWSETYPNSPENKEGLQRFFKQFSFPGGHGSHMTPEVSTEHH
jgi:xylulose-5-phosphate/fructose-6-phosphate phosphoketolase